MIRLAAVGDIHFGPDLTGSFRPHLERLSEMANTFLMAGDLTLHGDPEEARALAKEIQGIDLPMFAVLGNHDYHSGRENEVRKHLESAGVTVLEGDSAEIVVDHHRVGIAGTKGFGGGFFGACGTEFGEPEMKSFIGHTRSLASNLESSLRELGSDFRIALIHYSPIEETLLGERLEIYPFLGSHLLAEAVDVAGADIVFHGHSHHGREKGVTPGGIPVRNVAQAVIKTPFNIYRLGDSANEA